MIKKFIYIYFLLCSFLAYSLNGETDALKQNGPLSVVIIGGGPAGLATAIEAQQKGAQVTLIEKRSSYSRGQSILLDNSTLELLEKWQITCPQITVLNADSGLKSGLVGISDLEKSLAERVNELGIKILHGEFKSLKNGESQAVVATSHGEVCLPYDLLIGADGAHSCVREALNIPLHRYGKAIGAVSVVLLPNSTEISLDTTKQNELFIRRIMVPPISITFAQSSLSSIDRISAEHFAQAARQSGWQEEAKMLEEEKVLLYVDSIPIVLQQAQHFSDEGNGVILVGDAAATASFFEGRGANTAFSTAALAGHFITKFQACEESAYTSFNQAMQETTDKLVEGSRYLFTPDNKGP